MNMLNDSSRSERPRAYHILEEAASLNHTSAKRMVAIAYLFGSNGLPFRPAVAKEFFEQLAEEGDSESQLYLGFMHSFGLETPPSQAKALISYTFAALGGNHLAQMALGYRLYAGVSVLHNCEAALDHYRRVAKIVEQSSTGQSPSGTTVRIRLSDEYENPSKSPSNQLDDDLYQYYQFLADKGDVQAQVGLGHLHYQGGRGVQQDHTRALNYFKQAAQTGNANAMAYLGRMFLEGGKTVPQNNESAFKYFQMAADKGSSVGQAGLGQMFLYGKGVPRDYEKALKFLTLAANQGLVDGQLELGNMFYNGLGVEKNFKLALKYYKLASKQGHALAFYHLAMMHARGIGTQRSCANAVDGFKLMSERGAWISEINEAYQDYKAGRIDQALVRYAFLADLGYEHAQSNTAFILDRGESTLFDRNQSLARALSYWSRAASQGYVVARLKLGDYHYYGFGTEADYSTSAFHYRYAAENDRNPQAMFNLGYMHEQGYGMSKDIHLAKRYYDLAAATSSEAQVPVMFALMKMAIIYGFEYLNHFRWDNMGQAGTVLQKVLGPDWDLYVMSFLAALIAVLAYVRRFV
ncbi:protein sel-1 homolog 1 [Galendromus occidentalis]|uniref:Protein sel-1 homolog 1 n=1 Tax=Galendromus occidentalis TaxID=34638 RepID=A0AAJ7P991_9ACAR|nr:protein sel-1 homolog 1 [Galendromus occidentalis]